MANKNSSFIGEAVDSVIIGGLAYYFFKGIIMISGQVNDISCIG